jgi:hypothetical protein
MHTGAEPAAVPLENTIRVLTCMFPTPMPGPHGVWDDPSMPLSIVTALVRNLVTLPGAVLRSRVAKDAEVLALRHRTRCCAVRAHGSATSPPTEYGSSSCPDWSRASAGARSSW